MTMYNQATQEIAKPSELLTSVRAYMTVLQSIENYVTIDITRVFNNVLLQQTQHLDSHGEPTITSLYTNWYVCSEPNNVFRNIMIGTKTHLVAKKSGLNLFFHEDIDGSVPCFFTGCASLTLLESDIVTNSGSLETVLTARNHFIKDT